MAVIYVTLVPATAYYWIHPSSRFQRWTFTTSLAMALLILTLIPLSNLLYEVGVPQRLATMGIPFNPLMDPTNRLKGWDLMGRESLVHAKQLENQTGKPVVYLFRPLFDGIVDRVLHQIARSCLRHSSDRSG